MSEKDTLFVLAASYDDLQTAEADYEAVKDLYDVAGIGHDFDATVIQRDADGKSHVVKKHEESTRHGAKWGLAIGAASAVLPGIGLLGGMAVGAGIGALTGHIKGGMSDASLKQVAATLEKGQAGLIVVYATSMNDQINATLKAENKYIADDMKVDRAALDKQMESASSS
ncbi:MAG: DUF1269 domain-containing protein [Solirubrobacterales bacterium]